MAFPATPLDVKVELQLNGTWTDVTSYVYTRSPIQISRGRQDEDSRATPGSCRLMLNNRDGRFSPRNPTGPYYGLIGRNTPLRVSARLGGQRLTGGNIATPDSAGISITGDIDIRVDARLSNWNPNAVLIGKFSGSPGQRSYRMFMNAVANVVLEWSTDGSSSITASSTVPVPTTTGRQAVRATLDVDNGAAGRTVTFYTAPTLAGPWTQLGDPVVQAGVTSIFDSTDQLTVGGGFTAWSFYGAEVRQGIGGTVRANPDFTAQAEGATSFADSAGNTWTAVGQAVVTNRRYRFYGEVSSWPQAWDLSQKDVWVPVEAAGILRRLGQGSDPLQGTIRRAALTDPNVKAYWPMEDAQGSTSIASALSGGAPMTITGTPDLASNEDFPASRPLPVMNGAAFTGAVTAYTATGTIHAHCLLSVPAGADVDESVIMRIYTTGTAARWDFVYDSSGGLNLYAFDSANVQILTQGVGYQVNGTPSVAILELVQSGSDITYTYGSIYLGTPFGLFSGTLVGRTVGAATAVQVDPNQTFTGTAIGHVTVLSATGFSSALNALYGYPGETAGRRIERLCSENGIAFTAYGDLDRTAAVGAQRPDMTLLDIFAQCEASDLGQLFESRDSLALAYRTRDSRQYQPAALAMSYNNLRELTPVEDDQKTRNDVTVSRIGGSSARVTVDTGTLSTQAPPNGVGRYVDSVELSLYTDSQCADQAQWRATVGTVDEPRYPTVVVHLEVPAFAASQTLTDGALSVDHGDLITISNPPAWLPPDQIKQHTVGQVETLGVYAYEIDYTCTPITPTGATGLYDVTGRYSPSGSTTGGTLTSGATGAVLSIATTAGNPLWTTNVADFPLDVMIAGERITLSGISGTSSPQTGTVSVRAVNGVAKAHSAGEAIDIVDATYYAF